MEKVSHLKVVEKTDINEASKTFDDEAKIIGDWLRDRPNCGYIILAYQREDKDAVNTEGRYFFNDVMDRFWLPDYAREKIRSLIFKAINGD